MRVESNELRSEKYTDAWLIEKYLSSNTVDDAMWEDGVRIPFSYITFRRTLERYGIIPSAGRHTDLTEILHFFKLKVLEPNTPLERLYRDMPPTFKTSVQTLHRIYKAILKETEIHTRRNATALVIHPEGNPNMVLMGKELRSNLFYGKKAGDWTIPMTFSKQNELARERVLRVIQQEVFSKEAINGMFAISDFEQLLLSRLTGPKLRYRILDVDVTRYDIELPSEIINFSSYKIVDHTFFYRKEIVEMPDESIRLGVKDLVMANINIEKGNSSADLIVSDLNLALCQASYLL